MVASDFIVNKMAKIWVALFLCYFSYCAADGPDPYLRETYIGTGETGQILRQILKNYDSYVRPAPPGGGPTKMEIWIRVIEVMWRDDDLYLKGSFNRRWVDERLKFEPKPGGREDITIDATEFRDLIWQPDLVFITHYSNNAMGRGLITIHKNGTIHHKNLDTAIINMKKSNKDQKSYDAVFTAADFGNDKNAVTYTCPKAGCIFNQNERGKVKIENIEYSTALKTIADREYEVVNVTMTLTREI